jgi:hypothetical protein
MSTGPSGDSAETPTEPEPPFTGGGWHSWLVSQGRHPVTWAVAGVVLLGSTGVALLQQQPGGRARTQSVYCGLVKCAVLRSVADSSSTVAVGVPRPSPALPSSKAPSGAPASTRAPVTTPAPTPSGSRSPQPVVTSRPAPSPAPTPTATPTPKLPPPGEQGPSRWPWPPTWGQSWGHGGQSWGHGGQSWGHGGGRHARPSGGYWQLSGRHHKTW